ncbi:MAG: CYTH domain-containing protein [Candidatus Thermoplasmatota archaeon]|nr:CYTH domain-containing protein [Candidatus Thermoplasmatota archaeon]
MGAGEVEIERRFLIDGRSARPWVDQNEGTISMAQVYLGRDGLSVDVVGGRMLHKGTVLVEDVPKDRLERIAALDGCAVRLRMENDRAVLTLKGPRTGATAAEHEFPVDVALARDALGRSDLPMVEKTRHLWRGDDGHLWEIDEFEGPLAGLIIAEVELVAEDEHVVLPAFLGLEVTTAKSWSSHSLAKLVLEARRKE